MLKRLTRRAVAVNTLAIAASAAAVGGIALASAGLSSAPSHPDHAVPAASDHAAPAASDHARASTPAHPTRSDSDSTGTHPSSTPSPSLTGLCKAWLARPSGSGKADSSAAFTVLVTTAGGADAVDGYCTDLLATSSHPTARHTPALPSQASDHRTSKPAHVPPVATPSHPTGRP